MKKLLPRLSLSFVVVALGACGDDAHDTGTDAAVDPDGTTVVSDATWVGEIGALLNEECGACHQQDGLAPFAINYADVLQWAPAIKKAVQDRTMPPMPVSNAGDCQTYDNARWLSDEEIALIAGWVDAGAPRGEGELTLVAPSLPELERIDVELTTPAYTPDDSETDDYRCFPVAPGVDVAKFITAYEVVPGDAQVVHHVILFEGDAEEIAARDEADEGPGYQCFGQATGTSLPVVLWAPGARAAQMPVGTGLSYSPDKGYAIQVHYNVAQGKREDPGTHVRLTLEDEVEEEGSMIPIFDFTFSLPPQTEEATNAPKPGFLSGMPTFGGGFKLYFTGPHMHTLGRTQKVVATQDGQETCIADVDRWDFNWQQGWVFSEPLEFPEEKGDVQFRLDCSWSTMERSETVTWGDGTMDEMCLNFVYATGLSFGF